MPRGIKYACTGGGTSPSDTAFLMHVFFSCDFDLFFFAFFFLKRKELPVDYFTMDRFWAKKIFQARKFSFH